MADKSKNEKRVEKSSKANPNGLQKFGGFFVRIAKKLKSFFVNLKAELKRVIWPDRKRLIQSTATVLAICLIISAILFLVDTVIRESLKAVGFYTPSVTTVATIDPSSTTAATTTTAASGTSAATSPTTSVAPATTTIPAGTPGVTTSIAG